ncbi:hypothetical protein RRF57_002315 [Xylaria bambusicola]|uniref:C2H2-type domain-containing protein n=1 Tax=Xylaria bambusicola TaxID=326684 RepID=A0AAN7YVI4_9PEZI
MTDSHWKVYKCPFSCDVTFTSPFDCKNHIISEHSGLASLSHVDDLVGLGVQRIDPSSSLSCPFCPEKIRSIKQYQRHVGRNQEQLALFALPNLDCGDEQSNDYAGGGFNENTGHSTESSNWESVSSSHQVNTPLSAETLRRSVRNGKSSNGDNNEDLISSDEEEDENWEYATNSDDSLSCERLL